MEAIKLEQNCPGRGVGGWAKVEYIEAKMVESMIVYPFGVTVTLDNDGAWKEIAADEIEATPEPTVYDSHKHSITMLLGGRSRNYAMQLEAMSESRYVLKLTDNDGDKWIVGSKETPLRMSWKDLARTDEEGGVYEIDFAGETRMPMMKMND